ncbi:MAG: SEC-C metal-binding domain-containing protein, partial [Egibacteraceae bacterium]
MAKTGRNQPCSCGSGRKAKRCCGVTAGPSPDQLARTWLQRQARDWAPLLADYTDT